MSQTHILTAGETPPPLLAQLRAETKEAHLRMEALPSLSCLLSPGLTPSAYGFALRALHALHAGAAGTLDARLAAFPGMPVFDRARFTALDEDLAWFGITPRGGLGLAAYLKSAPAALGVLYVLEGSALGGRVIGKALRETLNVQPGRGGSFFCGTTAEATRARWLLVSAALNNAGAMLTPRERQCCVRAARGAFDALAHALAPDSGRGCPASAAPQISHRPAETGRATR